MNFRARYYDPYSTKFLSEDPSGFLGGDFNLYSYVSNSPLTYKDPEGEIAIPLIIPLLPVLGKAAAYTIATIAAYKGGQALADAYMKQDKPKSKIEGSPLDQKPFRSKGPTPTEILLGLAAGALIDKCTE